MSSGSFDARELLPMYVLGELEPDEHARVTEALTQDAELRAEEVQWRRTLGDLLATTAPDAGLSDSEISEFEQLLQDSIAREARGELRVAGPVPADEPDRSEFATSDWASRLGQALWPVALAASLASLAVAVWAIVDRPDAAVIEALEAESRALSTEVAELRALLASNSEEIDRVASSLRTLGYPQGDPIVLAGLEAAPRALGAAFYRPSAEQALFFAFGLPPIDARSSYQLWYITDDGPVSAGVFEIDRAGEARVLVDEVPQPDQIAAWAVTREPAGGSSQPSGPMLIRS